MNVLIVDDDKEESLILETHLENSGYKSVVYNLPKEALREIQKQDSTPDILIVDLNMPEVNGIQLVVKMREFGLDIPVILTCTDPDKTLLDKTLDMGLNYILHKPIQKEELLGQIEELKDEFNL
ncbi:MAG: response regulator [Bacteriovoracaceae bacterium]